MIRGALTYVRATDTAEYARGGDLKLFLDKIVLTSKEYTSKINQKIRA